MNNRLHYFPNARIGTAYFLKDADDVYACVRVCAVPAQSHACFLDIELAIFSIAYDAGYQPASGGFV